jgi:hypothetical protein
LRAHLLDMLSEAEEKDEVGVGFAQRFGQKMELSRNRRPAHATDAQALALLKAGSGAVDRDLFERALRVEAGARTRERVARIGKTIDDLVAAAQATPQRFERYYSTGRAVLAESPLPAKVVAAFRARLPEIPRAALLALAERDPEVAIDLIGRRSGAAHPKFGVSASVVQMIAKQARAKLNEDGSAHAIDNDANVVRMLADREEALASYDRGEDVDGALSVRGVDGAAVSHRRRLRVDGHAARQKRERQEKAATVVRKRLAEGLEPGSDGEAGVDLVYTRDVAAKSGDVDARGDVAFTIAAGVLPRQFANKIRELVMSDESASVIAGTKLITMLERINPALTKRVERHVLREAHEIIDIVESGIDWPEAVRLARESVDVSDSEREALFRQFAEQSDHGWAAQALADVLKAERDADNPTAGAARH